MVNVIAGALLGGVLGYMARASEFRRDQRLRVYAEFTRTCHEHLLAAQEVAADNLAHRKAGFESDDQSKAYAAWRAAAPAFNTALAQLALVASPRVLKMAEFLHHSIDSVFDGSDGEPSTALTGQLLNDVNGFAFGARRDVIGRVGVLLARRRA